MKRTATGAVLLAVAAATLGGCYVVSPYAYYPAPPPAVPAPVYIPPSVRAPAPPAATTAPAAPAAPSGSPAGAPGEAQAPRAAASRCETVTVEAHWETRVMPDGRRETVWVPTHEERVCQ